MRKELISLLFILILFFTRSIDGVDCVQPIPRVNEWMRREKSRRDLSLPFVTTLSTVGLDQRPYTYPIEVINITQKNGIFFFTKNGTQTVENLNSNSFVTLNIYLPKTGKQIFISGKIKSASSKVIESAWKKLSRRTQSTFLDVKISDRGKTPNLSVPTIFCGYQLIPDQVFFHTNATDKAPEKEQFKLENNSCWLHCP